MTAWARNNVTAERFAGSRGPRTAVRPRAASDADLSKSAKAAAVAGLIANPVVLVSEFFLKTTGEGLPPGPGGIYGATEGVSYLVVVGIAAWSIYKKVKTGSGLPGTLLGAAEGLSFLSIVAGREPCSLFAILKLPCWRFSCQLVEHNHT